MTAVRDIITGAARLLGAVAQGTPLSAGDAADGLTALNSILDAWNINALMVFTKNFDTYNIVPNKPSYTIGPTGDIAVPPQLRPNGIDRVILRITATSPYIDQTLEYLNDDQWSSINLKSLASTLPTKCYSTGDFPNLTLFLWPVPTQANQMVLWTWNQVLGVADINQQLNLPPGYERCIRYNLAVELAAEYGIAPSPIVMQIAQDSLAAIKRINSPIYYLECDPATLSAPTAFNYLTGK